MQLVRRQREREKELQKKKSRWQKTRTSFVLFIKLSIISIAVEWDVTKSVCSQKRKLLIVTKGAKGSVRFQQKTPGLLIVFKGNIWTKKKTDKERQGGVGGAGGQNVSGVLLKLWILCVDNPLFSACVPERDSFFQSGLMSHHLRL